MQRLFFQKSQTREDQAKEQIGDVGVEHIVCRAVAGDPGGKADNVGDGRDNCQLAQIHR